MSLAAVILELCRSGKLSLCDQCQHKEDPYNCPFPRRQAHAEWEAIRPNESLGQDRLYKESDDWFKKRRW